MAIGDPAEQYFKDGIWAYDASATAWVKLLADANGYLKVAEQTPLSGFATAANQATIITALQSLQNLVGALNDVGLDELRVMAAQYGSTWKIPRATTEGRLIVVPGIDGSTPEMLNVDSAGTLAVTPAKYGAGWETLLVDVNNYLRTVIESSALPTGAATNANQTTIITALQLIDDLRTALVDVGEDELRTYFVGQAADVEVKQTASADLVPGIAGWDGSAWHKLPMLWGYSDRWIAQRTGTASDTGDARATTLEVPEGYVYVLQHLAFQHNATAAKRVTCYLVTTAEDVAIYDQADVAPHVWYPLQREAVLKHQDTLHALCYAPGDGKTILLRVWGYQMKIAE